MCNQSLREVILELFDIGVFQFGNFTLKTGINSPIYIDLRRIISKPKLLVIISKLMWKDFLDSIDVICGVPYTALPIATILSIEYQIPLVLKRKEEKNYGLKKKIEGIFHEGNRCVIIEDVITSGSSILETKKDLEKEGLLVKEALVFLNRGQGGENNLLSKGIKVYSVCSLFEVLDILLYSMKIDQVCYERVINFLNTHRV